MDAMSDPAAARRGYLRGQLDEAVVSSTWLEQLQLWYADAAADPAVVEANAMQVATVDAAGHPSVRTVLLKGFDDRGVVFYTNYESAKARDLEANPYAAAVLVWLSQERQVRLSGPVTRLERAETEAYFDSRPRGSQLSAWASPQSTVVPSRAVLEDAAQAVEQRFAGSDVPAPPNWGGYRVTPEVVEFWQGRADRLHDRIRYRLDGDSWVIERLAP
ncbi:MAG: pyridoxamine 5-phosphate oxidase [Pseudonocardiales bacterium]|jgi:pyridoxamine 5'-phosphate oxidase|nr:pyridoxamine 5-phosphate oxidase [Pseudonocardiales bacterium]MDT4978204.1 pyridoxamine 5-phosphate oxidase [Pseudonocardiales bacterium]